MMIDYPPLGVRPPLWWGVELEPAGEYVQVAAGRRGRYQVREGEQLGIELPGAVLTEVGLAVAPVHPEHTILYHLVAVD